METVLPELLSGTGMSMWTHVLMRLCPFCKEIIHKIYIPKEPADDPDKPP